MTSHNKTEKWDGFNNIATKIGCITRLTGILANYERKIIMSSPLRINRLEAVGALVFISVCSTAQAELSNPISVMENKTISETWLNAGFYSYHFNRDKGLNDRNWGLGIEYRFSTVASVTAGTFYNSDREQSNYIGAYYQPIALGPVRIGAVIGGFDGYPRMRNGDWFLAVLPVASMDYGRVGLNLAVVPNYKDRLYGAISFQLKFKISN